MRKLALLAAASIAAIGFAAPAQAQVTQIMGPGANGTFSGNDCTGGFSDCYATQTGINDEGGAASAVVIKFNGDLTVDEISSNYSTIDGTEFTFNFNEGANTLSFTYDPGADDPILHYFDIKQSDAFVLFYDAAGLLESGTINLSTYFPNNPGISHINFFDENPPPGVPEPATWAMMLLGFGATGVAMRRNRRRKGVLAQIA